MPRGLPAAELAALPAGDAARGETWFWAGGCASCHAAAKAEGEDRLQARRRPGARRPPSATSSSPTSPATAADGIGAWSAGDFANAMLRGVSPDGRHLYPAFPYTSFARMKPARHRRSLGLPGDAAGRRRAGSRAARAALPLRHPPRHRPLEARLPAHRPRRRASTPPTPRVARGQYLVEGPGHCGECHTPRNFAGALDDGRWLAGAPDAGAARAASRTSPPARAASATGRAEDIAYFLETGFTPDFDSVGGSWSRCRRTWRCSPPTTAPRSPPTSRRCRRGRHRPLRRDSERPPA